MRNDKYVKTSIVHNGNPLGLSGLRISIDMDGVISHPEIYGEDVCNALKVVRALKNDFFDLKTVFALAGNDTELLDFADCTYQMIKNGFGKTLADVAKYQGSDEFHKKLLKKVYLLADCLYSPVHPDKHELKVTLYHILEMFPEDLTAKNIVAETNFNFKEVLFIKDFLARD